MGDGTEIKRKQLEGDVAGKGGFFLRSTSEQVSTYYLPLLYIYIPETHLYRDLNIDLFEQEEHNNSSKVLIRQDFIKAQAYLHCVF